MNTVDEIRQKREGATHRVLSMLCDNDLPRPLNATLHADHLRLRLPSCAAWLEWLAALEISADTAICDYDESPGYVVRRSMTSNGDIVVSYTETLRDRA